MQGGSLGALTPPTRCNCAEWICNALADAGVTHVFGGHGGALAPLVNAVVRHPKLTWVVTRNEANASLMAAAYSKLTGMLGVCIATSGPGATNLTTGLFDATLDQCAMIAITGMKPRGGIGYSEFQDFQQSRMFAGGGLIFSVDVASPDALVPLLRDGVTKAVAMQTCVHLGVPVDIQAAQCPVPVKKFCAVGTLGRLTFPAVQEAVLDTVAMELTLTAKRCGSHVLIAVGHGCIAAGAHILKLAEWLRAPVITRLDAKGCCDESHPLVLGVTGVHGKPGLEKALKLIETAQLVLSFGSHDDTIVLCNKAGLQVRPMIRFEPNAACIMATARYRALHVVTGDPVLAIDSLLEKLDKLSAHGSVPEDTPSPEQQPSSVCWQRTMVEEWSDEVAQSGMDTQAPLDALGPGEECPAKGERRQPPRHERMALEPTAAELWEEFRRCDWRSLLGQKDWNKFRRFSVLAAPSKLNLCHPAFVLHEASERMGSDDVLCVDTGDVTLWASLCALLTKGQRTLSSERLGTMGYSLVAGIVACLVRGDAGRGVVVAGDGGIQMTINELGTVKQIFANSETQYKLLVIVFDNEMLARVQYGFEGALGCQLGPSPDFVQIAKAYGGDGFKLTSAEELPTAMEKAFTASGLFLLHVPIDPDVKADMAAFTDNSIQMMNSG